jgi:hypothetical protein
MSEQKWTPQYVEKVELNYGWAGVAHNHNTALAAERANDELHTAALQVLERHHQKQLAAERKKREQAEAIALDSYEKAKAIRSELAAVLKQRDDFRRALEQRVGEADKLREALKSLLNVTDHLEHIRPQLNKAADALGKEGGIK